MAKDHAAIVHPGRRSRWLAALAFLGLFAVALTPRLLDAIVDEDALAAAPLPEFLGRYASEAGLAAICSEPEILGEAHGLCGLGRGLRPSSVRVLPPAPPKREIRFARNDAPSPIGNYESPVLDNWEVGLSDLPGILVTGGPSTGGGGGGVLQIASSGGGGIPLINIDDDSDTRVVTDDDPDTDTETDTDTDPNPENPVPEPTAGLLFGAGFLAILSRRRLTR